MTTVNSRPDEICFSRDPIQYGLHTDLTTDTAGLTIEVALFFCEGAESVFTQIYKQPCYPNSDGNVTFYPGDIINSMLQYSLPDLAAADIVDRTSQVGRFYIEYREISMATPSPVWTSDSANIRSVIKGGTSYERWKGGNFFSVYLPSEKPFLTWQVSGRLAADTERMYLSYLHTSAVTAGVTAKVRVLYTDATETATAKTLAFPTIQKNHIYQLPTGLQQLAITAPAGKQIYCWEVTVSTASALLAGPFRYELDNRPAYNPLTLHYVNSQGGLDSIRMTGAAESAIVRTATVAERVTTGFNNNQVTAQLFASSIDLNTTISANTGFLGKTELLALLDILVSRGVYQEKAGRWQPLVLTSQKIALPSSIGDLFSLPLEFQEGYKNSNWTPTYKNL